MENIWIFIYSQRFEIHEHQLIRKNILDNNKNIKIMDPKKVIIKYESNNKEYFYAADKDDCHFFDEGIHRLDLPTKVYSKMGCMLDNNDINILNSLHSDGVFVINRWENLIMCADKKQTLNMLNELNLKSIDSIYINAINGKALVNNPELFDLSYPLILKSKKGSLGTGVYKIESFNELKNMVEHTYLIDKSFEFLIQEYIEEGSTDYRVVAFNGEIKYVIKHEAVGEEFRSNYALGAKVDIRDEYTKELEVIVKKIYDETSINVMGLDLFRKDNEFIVCEINSNPGYSAYNKIKDEDFTIPLMEFIEKV